MAIPTAAYETLSHICEICGKRPTTRTNFTISSAVCGYCSRKLHHSFPLPKDVRMIFAMRFNEDKQYY